MNYPQEMYIKVTAYEYEQFLKVINYKLIDPEDYTIEGIIELQGYEQKETITEKHPLTGETKTTTRYEKRALNGRLFKSIAVTRYEK